MRPDNVVEIEDFRVEFYPDEVRVMGIDFGHNVKIIPVVGNVVSVQIDR